MHGHPGWHDRRFVPVAGDGCGNYYVSDASLGLTVSPIFFVDTFVNPLQPAYVVASNLWLFLRFLFMKDLGKSRWPFSREEVLANDPAILHVSTAPLLGRRLE
jgi:hypothetical protein